MYRNQSTDTSIILDQSQDEIGSGDIDDGDYSGSNSDGSSDEHDIIDDGVIIEKMDHIGKVKCFFHDK